MKNAQTDGPSPCGYHFLQTYLRCPRSWYLKYHLNLEARKTSVPLVFGHAWHTALERFLQGQSLPGSLQAGLEDLSRGSERLSSLDQYDDLKERLVKGLPQWAAEWNTKFSGWKVLSVEDLRMVPIADGLTFSVRFDAVLQDPDGRVWIGEHKTTGWSTDKTVQGVELGDQVTGYQLAYNRTEGGLRAAGCLLDVTEFKSSGIKTTFWRIVRSQDDQVNMELSLVGQFNDLNQRVQAVQQGYPPFAVFPRSSEFCSVFGCEYVDICRTRVEQGPLPPTSEFIVRNQDPQEEVPE